MIGRIARVVFALAFGASATRARGGGPSVALTFRSARPPATHAPSVDRVVRPNEIGRFNPPPGGVLGFRVDLTSVPARAP
jgi:hypothetical protein